MACSFQAASNVLFAQVNALHFDSQSSVQDSKIWLPCACNYGLGSLGQLSFFSRSAIASNFFVTPGRQAVFRSICAWPSRLMWTCTESRRQGGHSNMSILRAQHELSNVRHKPPAAALRNFTLQPGLGYLGGTLALREVLEARAEKS